MEKTCIFETCDIKVGKRSIICTRHRKQRERGEKLSPLAPRPTLHERFWATVNKADGCWEWTNKLRPDGYGSLQVGGRKGPRKLAHRVSYEWAYGEIPAGAEIDHICRNRACVRPEHLRAATKKQNMENRVGANRNSKSGVLGVSWYKALSKWHAQITHNRSNIHLGYFDTVPEAEAAVIAKRLELFTHNELDRMAA